MTLPHKIYSHPFGIKEYVYPNHFKKEEIEDIIKYLQKKYYSVGNTNPIGPGLQTPGEYNLFLEDKFKILLDTFLESVCKYVNRQKLIDSINLGKYNMYAWCYLNWKSSIREDPGEWHIHNPTHPDAITGVFYLKLPKVSGGETRFHIAGNKFELPSNEWSWFLFPSSYTHSPGKVFSTEKRYVISTDIWFD